MIKGDVCSGVKKLGQTRPPMLCSILAAVVFPKSLERRKRKTPFHAGHTGRRANFSDLEMYREFQGFESVLVLIVEALMSEFVALYRGNNCDLDGGETPNGFLFL